MYGINEALEVELHNVEPSIHVHFQMFILFNFIELLKAGSDSIHVSLGLVNNFKKASDVDRHDCMDVGDGTSHGPYLFKHHMVGFGCLKVGESR